MSEDEIDLLLKGLVTQATVDLQCTHSQESVGEISSSVEKDDRLVDQQIDNVFLHKDDKAIMFDNLEDCFVV